MSALPKIADHSMFRTCLKNISRRQILAGIRASVFSPGLIRAQGTRPIRIGEINYRSAPAFTRPMVAAGSWRSSRSTRKAAFSGASCRSSAGTTKAKPSAASARQRSSCTGTWLPSSDSGASRLSDGGWLCRCQLRYAVWKGNLAFDRPSKHDGNIRGPHRGQGQQGRHGGLEYKDGRSMLPPDVEVRKLRPAT